MESHSLFCSTNNGVCTEWPDTSSPQQTGPGKLFCTRIPRRPGPERGTPLGLGSRLYCEAQDERGTMDKQNDPKYDFKAPEENIRKWQPKKWEDNAFQGVSPFDFAMRQKNEEKKRKEREREAKARMYNYEGKGVATLAEMNAKNVNQENEKGKQAARQMKEDSKKVNMAAAGFGVEQAARAADFQRDQAAKELARQTRGNLKDVNMAAAGFGAEQAARNADHHRDKAWKDAQRKEKEAQKDVNMARAGFGVEQASRNADFEREKAWKEEQRIQKEKQQAFDMAKALF